MMRESTEMAQISNEDLHWYLVNGGVALSINWQEAQKLLSESKTLTFLGWAGVGNRDVWSSLLSSLLFTETTFRLNGEKRWIDASLYSSQHFPPFLYCSDVTSCPSLYCHVTIEISPESILPPLWSLDIYFLTEWIVFHLFYAIPRQTYMFPRMILNSAGQDGVFVIKLFHGEMTFG